MSKTAKERFDAVHRRLKAYTASVPVGTPNREMLVKGLQALDDLQTKVPPEHIDVALELMSSMIITLEQTLDRAGVAKDAGAPPPKKVPPTSAPPSGTPTPDDLN